MNYIQAEHIAQLASVQIHVMYARLMEDVVKPARAEHPVTNTIIDGKEYYITIVAEIKLPPEPDNP